MSKPILWEKLGKYFRMSAEISMLRTEDCEQCTPKFKMFSAEMFTQRTKDLKTL